MLYNDLTLLAKRSVAIGFGLGPGTRYNRWVLLERGADTQRESFHSLWVGPKERLVRRIKSKRY